MIKLDRFIQAQNRDNTFNKAYGELEKGAKTSHWIWYIFPQLKALGSSETALYYGIENVEEACAYIQNEKLFDNYKKITLLVSKKLDSIPPIPLSKLMGSETDASKLVSSITLFHAVATIMAEKEKDSLKKEKYTSLEQLCRQVLTKVEQQGYKPCKKTTDLIKIEQATKKEPEQKAVPLSQDQSKPGPLIAEKKASSFRSFFADPSKNQLTPPHDYSLLTKELNGYIKKRESEWSFHLNFLGLVAAIYWIQDAVLGTDHFNSKHREIKITAANKLNQLIDGKHVEFDDSEKLALADKRLGKIVAKHGGLENIVETIAKEQKNTHSHNDSSAILSLRKG